MLYYNTTSTIMRIYSGSAWENVAVSTSGFATLTGVETFTNKTLTSPKINEDVIVTSTATELNLLDGVSGLVQGDLTKLAAIDATAAEIDTLDALSRGSIIYGNASAATTVLTKGTVGQVLTSDGTDISWGDVVGGTDWQSVVTASTLTAVAGNGYPINTTSNACTVTLPSSASVGDQVQIVDYAGTFATNIITLTSSLNIEGVTDDKLLTTNREGVTITYVDVTQGWVATSGVNSGNQALDPSPYSIDFLVVAGGGGGGYRMGGGGGAGGYITSTQSISIGTTITVTVGDGGAGSTAITARGTSGSNSSISGSGLSTITSAGGGGGGSGADSNTTLATGINGGSGGGGSRIWNINQGYNGGSGNTPSTSPSQGNNGGENGNGGGGPAGGSGGGGGAGAVGGGGGTASPSAAGNGGNGTASSITGSSVTRAGGGGGGGRTDAPVSAGSGGTGGGADGQATTTTANSASVNTGGGGGGGGNNGSGGAGGKGVVILSVPTASYSTTITGSPTVSTSGSNTIMKFTGTGSYTA